MRLDTGSLTESGLRSARSVADRELVLAKSTLYRPHVIVTYRSLGRRFLVTPGYSSRFQCRWGFRQAAGWPSVVGSLDRWVASVVCWYYAPALHSKRFQKACSIHASRSAYS
jgi:hypothetical protein